MDDRNLVLTGFMATGKSAIGAEVARQLGRRFLDTDTEIEQRAGKPIARIFSEDGEAAFRRMEATLCQEVSMDQGLVVATGGGTLVDRRNRDRVASTGTLVCLTCAVEEIRRRLTADGTSTRPLAEGDEGSGIQGLMRARRDAYASIPWHLDTTDLSVDQAAARIIELATAVALTVRSPDGGYTIHIGTGLLAHIGDALRTAGAAGGSRVALVCDPVVAPLWSAPAERSLRAAGFRPCLRCLPGGEQHKCLSTIESLYERFLDAGLGREDTVLSLGGGLTGDMAGFSAATYLRGVRFVQVPTTLLAMVDASIGGKTGVNLSRGKNLVGAFKQPALVLVDPQVLNSLPEEELRCGVAETIKHGIIGDPELFEDLEAGPTGRRAWSGEAGTMRIKRAMRVKISIIEADPLETGPRAVLNLGHTVGHALESASHHALSHGEAVSVGIVAATRLATALGLAHRELYERVEAALLRWRLPTRCPAVPIEALESAMKVDKKRALGGLRWILPRRMGDVVITNDVPPEVVRKTLLELGARRST